MTGQFIPYAMGVIGTRSLDTPIIGIHDIKALNEKRIINGIPLGRAAQASEPAQMVLFFASDLASFVNGEIGDCDGGIVLDG